MSKKKVVQIWVDPLFKKKIKREALENDLKMAEFTRQIANKNDPLEEILNHNDKKKKKFKFAFP